MHTHPPTVPEGYKADAKGRLVPETMIRPLERLQDQTVGKIIGFARDLSSQVSRFKAHCFADVAAFMDIAASEYQTTLGGRKGNLTLTSFDGCTKVVVQVADRQVFGPELQIAKQLIDECLTSWAEGARAELRAVVDGAFDTDKEGTVNREAVLRLRRLSIDDETWQRAMRAIDDSIRVEGSTAYMRFYERPHPQANWTAITVDLASA